MEKFENKDYHIIQRGFHQYVIMWRKFHLRGDLNGVLLQNCAFRTILKQKKHYTILLIID